MVNPMLASISLDGRGGKTDASDESRVARGWGEMDEVVT